jgi:hypothetical protein
VSDELDRKAKRREQQQARRYAERKKVADLIDKLVTAQQERDEANTQRTATAKALSGFVNDLCNILEIEPHNGTLEVVRRVKTERDALAAQAEKVRNWTRACIVTAADEDIPDDKEEAYLSGYAAASTDVSALLDPSSTQAEQRYTMMRKALEYYAKEDIYDIDPATGEPPVCLDGGGLAQQALGLNDDGKGGDR